MVSTMFLDRNVVCSRIKSSQCILLPNLMYVLVKQDFKLENGSRDSFYQSGIDWMVLVVDGLIFLWNNMNRLNFHNKARFVQ